MNDEERLYYFDQNNNFKNEYVEREFFNKFIGNEYSYDFMKQLISNGDLKLDFSRSNLNENQLIFEVDGEYNTKDFIISKNKENQLIIKHEDINISLSNNGQVYATYDQDGATKYLETYRDHILEFDKDKYQKHYNKVTTGGYGENEIPDYSNAYQFIEPNFVQEQEFYKSSSLRATMIHILNAKSLENTNNISK